MVATVTPMPINTSERASPLKLNRLLQLCSANLPVGGFSFSQGLEFAVEKGWVNSAESTENWVGTNLAESIATTDLAILARLFNAIEKHNKAEFLYWNNHLLACRESAELHLADVAMGKALVRLLTQLDAIDSSDYQDWLSLDEISFVSSFALSAHLCGLDKEASQSGYCWTFIDNQIAAATKLVPLGQTQAQNLLFSLSEKVESAVALANELSDEQIGGSLPRVAMASAWHETQYTRLFRS